MGMTSRDTFRRYIRFGEDGLSRREREDLKRSHGHMPWPAELVKRFLAAFLPRDKG
jgi:hypothetical protein